jgi:hypothetical protein
MRLGLFNTSQGMFRLYKLRDKKRIGIIHFSFMAEMQKRKISVVEATVGKAITQF